MWNSIGWKLLIYRAFCWRTRNKNHKRCGSRGSTKNERIKACGPSGIVIEMVKTEGVAMLDVITDMINLIIIEEEIPVD